MPFNWSTLIAKAKNIQFFPSGNLSSVDVQGAIEELDAEKANISQTITDGVTTSAPSENAVFDAIKLLATLKDPVFSTNSPNIIKYQRTGVPKQWAISADIDGTYISNTTDAVLPIFITNAGNVGIGTTSPTSPLNVMSAENTPCANLGGNLFYYATDSKPNGVFTPRTMLSLYAGGTNAYAYSHRLSIAGGAISASGNANDKLYSTYILSSSSDSDGHATKTDIMTLRGNGNVGIGTTDPKATLHSMGSTIIGANADGLGTTQLGNRQLLFDIIDQNLTIYAKDQFGVVRQFNLTSSI